MTRHLTLYFILLTSLSVANASDVTLKRIMADPDWIGQAVETPYWGDTGDKVYFRQKRAGEDIRDLHRLDLESGAKTVVAPGNESADSNLSRRYSRDHSKVVWIADGDVFVKRLSDNSVQQLTQTNAAESAPMFLADGDSVAYLSDGRYVRHHLDSGRVANLIDLSFSDDPDKDESFDALREQQRRIYATVVEDKRRADAIKDEAEQRRRENASAPPAKLYLGKKYRGLSQTLSPDGRHLLVVAGKAKPDAGKKGKMPNYVSESGYTTVRDTRTRVGRNPPEAQSLILVDIENNTAHAIDMSTLPGIDDDPLEELRQSAIEWHSERGTSKEAVEKALKPVEQRSVQVAGIEWNPGGDTVAIQLISIDNKDRWLTTISTRDKLLKSEHRLTDAAWINYHNNEFGWLPDGERLWFLSEQSGYSHLYVKRSGSRRAKALTKGDFVVSDPQAAPNGSTLFFRSNKTHPSTFEIFNVAVSNGSMKQLTSLGGVNHFRLAPNGQSLLVSHTEFDRHADLFVADLAGETQARRLTDSVSEEFKAIDWVIPSIVEVPSSHVERPIYSKLYLPKDFDPAGNYPAVMFVHGAGYTQNAHAGWPYYFREFMFHTLLTERGYVVLDMDYRASKGYGRDWRTAIYRQMGHPELEDFQDGIRFLSDNYAVDGDRVGVYGGSYGGFMTLMALFREPDLFAAGAALRPVVDWMHYNHGYTANILNTPQIDPVAYQKSSPINFAEGLKRPLLVAAGMQDDNVFFQDVVLLAQRLIELEKENFEIAIYPLDPHGFVHASAWLDEYRRILKLFETHLKPAN